jgi:hypothetical protein
METSPLAGWDNFYVIVGSSAGGLTGLTFVVIALVSDTMRGVRPSGLGAFVTPTIVHFCGVLALAAFLSVPHQHLPSLSAGLGLAGIAGVAYGGKIGRHMSVHSPSYVPVREDWIFNVILPTCAYGVLLFMAVLMWYFPAGAMYGVAAATLALLLIGIRNAWDIAVFMAASKAARAQTPRDKE